MMGTQQRLRGQGLLHYAILVASLVLNASLVVRVIQMESSLRVSEAMRVIGSRDEVATGDVVPEFEAAEAGGTHTTVALTGRGQPTVIYVFSPTCHWCGRNWLNVNALAGRLRESHRLIGVSLSARQLARYAQNAKIQFPVYSVDMERLLGPGKKRFSAATPETLLIDTNGKVQRIWRGAYADLTKREMEAYFGVSLPGLTPEQAGIELPLR
jgi:peroxiredoxin